MKQSSLPKTHLPARAESAGVTDEFTLRSTSSQDDASSSQQPAANSSEDFVTVRDGVLAYEFAYPTSVRGRRLPIIMSRKPERYSSAAPLTADARQRIVAEWIDLRDALTISVTVGPASGVLRDQLPNDWTPKQVANQVLMDRSTARATSGQRVSLNYVESAAHEQRGGMPYWIYDHISQGSPSIVNADKETYRHAWSVTGLRQGLNGRPFLYTLTLACPEELWPDLGPLYATAQQSFRLTQPSQAYVPPDKDPWRFF